ncbi:hypothetical protein ASPU41_10575 [Arthrobacter sp. U41]|nr:hypothetical protein ASPU41_10575 [Arthrobacter sp. U41]
MPGGACPLWARAGDEPGVDDTYSARNALWWAANEGLSRNQYAEKNDDGAEQWGLTVMRAVPAGDSKFRRGGEALVEMLTNEVLTGSFADLDVEYSLPAKASGLFVLEQQELKNAAEEFDLILLGSLAYGVVSDVLSASVKHEISRIFRAH